MGEDMFNKAKIILRKISGVIKKYKTLVFIGTFLICLLVFLLLTAFVIFIPPQSFDVYFSAEIQERSNFILTCFMRSVSWIGNIFVSVFLILLTSASFQLFGYGKEALLMLSTILSGVFSWVLKALINRPRPTSDFVYIYESTQFQSFPSGHVLYYTAFFGALMLILLRNKNLHFVFRAMGIGFCLSMIGSGAISRIYLGAHWFTDVIGGFLAGILLLLPGGYLYFSSAPESEVAKG